MSMFLKSPSWETGIERASASGRSIRLKRITRSSLYLKLSISVSNVLLSSSSVTEEYTGVITSPFFSFSLLWAIPLPVSSCGVKPMIRYFFAFLS